MPVPYRPEDDLADHLIDELTADLDDDDARELAVELARMIDLGLLEVDDDLRIGVAERYALPAERPRPGTGPSGADGAADTGARRVWQPASRRPDRWGVNPAGSSRRR